MLTQPAAFSLTAETLDIKLHTGFDEREIAGAKTRFHFSFEELIAKFIHGCKKISKRDLLVDIQAFDLMKKNMGARADILFSIYSSGTDDAQRWSVAFHHTHLYVTCMGAQKQIWRDIKSVLHVS